MRFEKAPQGKRTALGSNGRSYTIGYALGQRNPWVVEHDDSRHRTIEEAEARCHEIEGAALDRDAEAAGR